MVAFVRRRKGRITLAVAIAIGIVVLLIALRSTGPALATSGGSAYVVPLAVDTNPAANIFETTISAEAHTVDIGNGVMANMLTFNGTVPGPELRLKVGDTVIVHFENHIAHPTGIHWHGIELEQRQRRNALTQNQVPPEGKFLYKFKVTRPGIYWYHPHHHSSTNQVFKGLYGVDHHHRSERGRRSRRQVSCPRGPDDDVGPERHHGVQGFGPEQREGRISVHYRPQSMRTAPPAFRQPPTAPARSHPGDVPNIQLAGIFRHGERRRNRPHQRQERRWARGRARRQSAGRAGCRRRHVRCRRRPGTSPAGRQRGDGPVLPSPPDRQRWNDTIQVPLIRVGGEGGLLDHGRRRGRRPGGFDFKYESGEVLLDPGDRVDVVAVFPPTATGVFTLWTRTFQRQGSGQTPNLPTVPVAHFNVVGGGGTVLDRQRNAGARHP